jgi:hypothetical protein
MERTSSPVVGMSSPGYRKEFTAVLIIMVGSVAEYVVFMQVGQLREKSPLLIMLHRAHPPPPTMQSALEVAGERQLGL